MDSADTHADSAGLPDGGAVASPAVSPDELTYDAAGLIPAIVQQHDTGEVLMLGWMNAEAVRRTLASGRTTFWSRSRRQFWVKGETSGNVQRVHEVRADCDSDALLVRVDQHGSACHTGRRSCFDTATVAEADATEVTGAESTTGTESTTAAEPTAGTEPADTEPAGTEARSEQ